MLERLHVATHIKIKLNEEMSLLTFTRKLLPKKKKFLTRILHIKQYSVIFISYYEAQIEN